LDKIPSKKTYSSTQNVELAIKQMKSQVSIWNQLFNHVGKFILIFKWMCLHLQITYLYTNGVHVIG
jgi:hypothetical protein